jgi:hypothetical protein
MSRALDEDKVQLIGSEYEGGLRGKAQLASAEPMRDQPGSNGRAGSLEESDLTSLLALQPLDLHLLLARGGADELHEASGLAQLLLNADAADSPGSSVTDSSYSESDEIDALMGSEDDVVVDDELYALDGEADGAEDQHTPRKRQAEQASAGTRASSTRASSTRASILASSCEAPDEAGGRSARKRTLSIRADEAADEQPRARRPARAARGSANSTTRDNQMQDFLTMVTQASAGRAAATRRCAAGEGEGEGAAAGSSGEIKCEIECDGSGEGKQPLLCPVPHCGRQFLWAWAREEHAKTHVADESRVFRCDQCDKSFFSRVVLKAHVRIHTRKPFSFTCSQPGCAKRYCTSEGLRLHQRNRHEADKSWTCPAEGCAKAFVRQSDLRLHILRMHAAERPHPCSIAGCAKSFACFSELTRHEALHRGRS